MCETIEESGTGFCYKCSRLLQCEIKWRYFRADQHQSVFKESFRLGSIEN